MTIKRITPPLAIDSECFHRTLANPKKAKMSKLIFFLQQSHLGKKTECNAIMSNLLKSYEKMCAKKVINEN
jgi:hypothetical protein